MNKPNLFIDTVLFFLLGLGATWASGRTMCVWNECVLVISGDNIFNASGVHLDSAIAELVKLSPIVFFGIAGCTFVAGLVNSRNKSEQYKIKSDSNSLEKPLLIGSKYYDEGNYRKAIQCYSQVLEINPNDNIAYVKRGRARHKLKDYEGAIDDYSHAIRINPNIGDAYFHRAMSRLVSGDDKGAIRDYSQAIHINSNDATAYFYRALAYIDIEDYENALNDCNQAIDILPNYGRAYYKRSEIYVELEDIEAAIENCRKAAEIFKETGEKSNYQKVLQFLKKIEREI